MNRNDLDKAIKRARITANGLDSDITIFYRGVVAALQMVRLKEFGKQLRSNGKYAYRVNTTNEIIYETKILTSHGLMLDELWEESNEKEKTSRVLGTGTRKTKKN